MDERARGVYAEWSRQQRVMHSVRRAAPARREVPLEEQSRVTQEGRDAWGSFVVGLVERMGGADLFGGLTYDQRRRGEQRMAMRRPLVGVLDAACSPSSVDQGGPSQRLGALIPGRVERIGGAEFVNAPTFDVTKSHVSVRR